MIASTAAFPSPYNRYSKICDCWFPSDEDESRDGRTASLRPVFPYSDAPVCDVSHLQSFPDPTISHRGSLNKKTFIKKDVKTVPAAGRAFPEPNHSHFALPPYSRPFCPIMFFFWRVRFSCKRFKETAYRVLYRMGLICGGGSARRCASRNSCTVMCSRAYHTTPPAAPAPHDVIDVTTTPIKEIIRDSLTVNNKRIN